MIATRRKSCGGKAGGHSTPCARRKQNPCERNFANSKSEKQLKKRKPRENESAPEKRRPQMIFVVVHEVRRTVKVKNGATTAVTATTATLTGAMTVTTTIGATGTASSAETTTTRSAATEKETTPTPARHGETRRPRIPVGTPRAVANPNAT
jgi:hypothetical protein